MCYTSRFLPDYSYIHFQFITSIFFPPVYQRLHHNSMVQKKRAKVIWGCGQRNGVLKKKGAGKKNWAVNLLIQTHANNRSLFKPYWLDWLDDRRCLPSRYIIDDFVIQQRRKIKKKRTHTHLHHQLEYNAQDEWNSCRRRYPYSSCHHIFLAPFFSIKPNACKILRFKVMINYQRHV